MTTRDHHPTTRPSSSDAPANADDGGWAIMLFAGAVILSMITCLDAAVVHPTGPRLAVLAVAVAVVAERAADPRSALGCAVLAFALGDGFLQHHAGSLGWQAPIDYPFALGLLGAIALGLSVGQIRLARRRRQRMRPFVALLGAAGPEGADGDTTPPPGGDRHPLRNHQDQAVADGGEPTV